MAEEKEEIKEETESTTDSLFPEFLEEEKPEEEEGKEQPEVKAKVEPVAETEGEPPVEQPQPEPAKQPDVTEYINLDELGDRKVKEIVNGKEVEVSLRELIGADQKSRASEQKFKEAAELRRQIAEERAQLERERNQFKQPQQPANNYGTEDENYGSQEEGSRLRAMELRFQELLSVTAPLQIEANRKRMKDKFQDFDTVFPKMQEYVATLPNSPENDRLINYFDKDPSGQELLYYKAKEKFLMENASKSIQPGPKSAPMERPAPPVVKIASGTSVSSSANSTDAEISAAKKKALKTNRDEDWAKLLTLQGY